MTSKVYFIDFRATSRESIVDKLARLCDIAGIKDVLHKENLAAVKIHFGEKGNTAFIRPPYIRKIIKCIKETGATPFLTDANTLYAGSRSDSISHITTAIANGFSYSSMDATPIIIADGLRGKTEAKIKIDRKNCSHVYIGSEIANADALVSVAHFKGHELAGFGGTLKNLGMGCASRKGKLVQHSSVSPKVKKKNCIGCLECINHCPVDAIELIEEKAHIDSKKCIGCGECIVRCSSDAVQIRWNQNIPIFLEKMVEYTEGVLKGKKNKSFYINIVADITPKCDCLPFNDYPIVRDIGILASKDPVAIDQASVDLVNNEEAL
ncbi:MAG: DUF362 domain-containing protein, partial [Desulfobacteraceae bacterium]|nr:DUF362 domain-containing protein [Desulfobacteraceae bacterium]